MSHYIALFGPPLVLLGSDFLLKALTLFWDFSLIGPEADKFFFSFLLVGAKAQLVMAPYTQTQAFERKSLRHSTT